MRLKYHEVEVEVTPARVKQYVEASPEDTTWIPMDGEACLVHDYIAAELRPHGLAPLIYVNGLGIWVGEGLDCVDGIPEEDLTSLIEAFDQAVPTDEMGYATRDETLRVLTERGVW